MKFKDLNEANTKLYMMISCEDGIFDGSGKISDLWSFAMGKNRQMWTNGKQYLLYACSI